MTGGNSFFCGCVCGERFWKKELRLSPFFFLSLADSIWGSETNEIQQLPFYNLSHPLPPENRSESCSRIVGSGCFVISPPLDLSPCVSVGSVCVELARSFEPGSPSSLHLPSPSPRISFFLSSPPQESCRSFPVRLGESRCGLVRILFLSPLLIIPPCVTSRGLLLLPVLKNTPFFPPPFLDLW